MKINTLNLYHLSFQVTMATGRAMMRAVRVFEFGGPEVLKLQSDVSLPVAEANQVKVNALC